MTTLVHIGWPKTATTWLQEQVFIDAIGYRSPLSREQIVRHFVLPDQLDFDPGAVASQIAAQREAAGSDEKVPVISHERLCGVLRNRFESVVFGERILAAVPDAKVLIVVREQKDAMLAAWHQYIRDGGSPATGPSVRSLSDYFGDEESRASVLPPPGDLRYFEYDRVVRWYVDRLGPERVLTLPLELLRADPGAFLHAVNAFSGAGEAPTPDLRPANQAWAPATYALKRRLNYLGDRRNPAAARSGYRRVMRATYAVDRVLPGWIRERGRSTGRDTVARLAGDHFGPSNRRLRELVDWDPAGLGYLTDADRG